MDAITLASVDELLGELSKRFPHGFVFAAQRPQPDSGASGDLGYTFCVHGAMSSKLGLAFMLHRHVEKEHADCFLSDEDTP